jgi:hypothetical protein
MTTLLNFDADTRTGTSGAEQDFSTGTSARRALFRHMVRLLLSCSPSKKAALRQAVIEHLLRAREPFDYFDELLDACTTSAATDRLDAAIDVLSATGEHLLRFAWSYLIRDVQEWNPYSTRAYRPNDDHWYIILRAVARCRSSEEARFRFISACRSAAQRGITEGVVEALGDLASPDAKEFLGLIAGSHEDPFIRDLASDALAGMESQRR